MFKPRIHKCQIVEDGEEFSFFVREPSGREILIEAEQAKAKKEKQPVLDSATELFSKYVVKEDGSAISKDEVEDLLSMRMSAMQMVSEQVQEKIGLTKMLEPKKA